MNVKRLEDRVDGAPRCLHRDGNRVDQVGAVVGQDMGAEDTPRRPVDDDLDHSALLTPRAGLAAAEAR